jgi:hypothetical protein
MDTFAPGRIYLKDVLLRDYRDVANGLDSDLYRPPDSLTTQGVAFQWVTRHARNGDTHSDEDNAYLRVEFPPDLCQCKEDAETFALAAFNNGVARIRKLNTH